MQFVDKDLKLLSMGITHSYAIYVKKMKRGIHNMKRIIFAPSKYIQGEGEIKRLAEYYSKLGKTGAFVLADSFIAANYREDITASFEQAGIPIILEQFNGECSQSEISRIAEDAENTGADVILGIGGGKTLDTAKAAAYYSGMPVIIVPTIASTDAPCSALSVIYSEEGQFERYIFLKSNPNIVIADTAIIAKAPVRLLVSGMGDALATYFEARACAASNAQTIAGGTCSKAALALARLCFDTLMQDGYKAKLSVENMVSSLALENIIEANTYLSGLGFESGGLAAAHAVHNGFTVLPDCHHMYHGEKVAFGTIVQLVLENADMQEIKNVIEFCKSLGLPTTLKQLGIKNKTEEKVMAVAAASCIESETIHNMPFKVFPDQVYSAVLVADALGSESTCLTRSV